VVNQRITQHTFATNGKFNVSVEGKNSISFKKNHTMIEVKDRIGTVTVTATHATAGVEVTISVTISKGSGYTCSIEFGDGTVKSLDDKQLPITTGTVKHTYTKPAQYTFKVACKNGLTPDPAVQTKIIEVQEKLKTIEVIPPGSKEGQPVIVKCQTNAVHGHGVVFTATAVPEFNTGVAVDMTGCNNKPSCESKPISNVPVRVYKLTCEANNLLGKVTTTIDFTIDGPIKNPSVKITKVCDQVKSPPNIDGYYLMLPSCIDFTAKIDHGSNAYVSIDYGDGDSSGQKKFAKGTPTNTWVLSHTYTKVGVFTVTATIANGDGVFPWRFTVKAFKHMNLACDTKTPQKAGLVYIKFKSNDPIVPPDVTFTMDFGDGRNAGSTIFDVKKSTQHIYTKAKTYTITTVFKNPVETVTKTCSLEIIEPITDLKIFFIPEHPPFGTTQSILAQVSKGSGMKVSYNFGYPSSPGTTTTVACKFPFILSHTGHSHEYARCGTQGSVTFVLDLLEHFGS
jgi:hypothetical protein